VKGVELRIILKWLFKKSDCGTCTGFIWLRMETGFGKHGNELLGIC
jgi:hypothetical protein